MQIHADVSLHFILFIFFVSCLWAIIFVSATIRNRKKKKQKKNEGKKRKIAWMHSLARVVERRDSPKMNWLKIKVRVFAGKYISFSLLLMRWSKTRNICLFLLSHFGHILTIIFDSSRRGRFFFCHHFYSHILSSSFSSSTLIIFVYFRYFQFTIF